MTYAYQPALVTNPTSVVFDAFELARQRVETARQELEEAKQAVVLPGRAYFKEGCKALFAQFPKLETFSWTAYTPYFNDGDECIFSANTSSDAIWINEEEFWETHDYDHQTHQYTPKPGFEDLSPMFGPVSDFLQQFEDDIMLELFGDHVKVTVDSQGASCESYSHD